MEFNFSNSGRGGNSTLVLWHPDSGQSKKNEITSYKFGEMFWIGMWTSSLYLL